MLQKFGEHIRGWFASIVIAVIAVAFVAWGLEYYIDRDAGASAAIAVVNGQKITQADFDQFYQRAQQQQEKALGHGLSEQEMHALKVMTLNQMISERIVLEAAQDQGFSLGLDQIRDYIQQIPQFQVNGQFSPQALQNAVYNMGYTSPDAFYTAFRDNELIQQLVNGLRGSAFVIPDELQAVYGLWQQKRNFEFALLPITQQDRDVSVTDQQIQGYYDANQGQFAIPAKVQLHYILLSRDALLKNVKVTEDQAQAYYRSNLGNFTVPANWTITRITVPTQKDMAAIAQQLKAKKRLTDIAEQKHQGWQSVTQTISAVDIAPALVNILNNLQVGQVSKPLPTPGGWTIFELRAKKPQHARPFVQVKEQIKKMLISQQLDQQAAKKSEQLSSVVFTNPTSLSAASEQTGLPIQTSPVITQKGEKAGVFSEQQVVNAAFSDNVIKEGNNSNPISLKNGGVIVVRRFKWFPSSVEPLASVRSRIIAQIKKQTALREAGLQAYTVQKQLDKGQSVKLDWQQRSQATRTDPTVDKQILQAAFSTPLNQYKTVELDNGYAIVRVSKIEEADFTKATPEQKEGLMTNLAGMRGMNEFQIYVRELTKSAKVEIKDKKLASSWSE